MSEIKKPREVYIYTDNKFGGFAGFCYDRPSDDWLKEKRCELIHVREVTAPDERDDRRAMVQGYGLIPWSLHERAWEKYNQRHRGQSAEKIAERGGFGIEEMDEYFPGWRYEASEIAKLKEEIERLQTDALFVQLRASKEERDKLRAQLKVAIETFGSLISKSHSWVITESTGHILNPVHSEYRAACKSALASIECLEKGDVEFMGIKIRVDPSLKEGEWRIEKGGT